MPDPLDGSLTAVVEEVWGRDAVVRASAITAGITNRNFRVDVGEESFVVRLAGRDTELLGIDRTAEFEAASAAARAGVGPPVFAFLPERTCLITRFVDGDAVPASDLEIPDVLSSVVRAIRAIHGMPALRSTFDPWEVVADHRRVAVERGVDLPVNCAELMPRLGEIGDALGATRSPRLACHNDLLNANLIRRGDSIVIVDYEYAGMNDPFFDLGNFSINNGISEDARARLLSEYFGDVTPWHEARLALMRIVSDFREALWGVAQQALSTLDFDYVAYAREHFERLRSSIEDPRYPAWLRSAAA
jgi:aminoglycoside phosphotransferase (APT) family kinase protein